MQRQSTFVRVHTSNPMQRNSFLVWVVSSVQKFMQHMNCDHTIFIISHLLVLNEMIHQLYLFAYVNFTCISRLVSSANLGVRLFAPITLPFDKVLSRYVFIQQHFILLEKLKYVLLTEATNFHNQLQNDLDSLGCRQLVILIS